MLISCFEKQLISNGETMLYRYRARKANESSPHDGKMPSREMAGLTEEQQHQVIWTKR